MSLVVALLVSTSVGQFQASGDTPQMAAMRKRLAQDRVRMRYLRREEGSILTGLRTLEQSINQKQRTLKELEKVLGRLEEKLKDVSDRLASSEQELTRLRKAAGQRAAAMHRIRRTRLASLLEHATDPAQARRLRDRLRYVFKYDKGLIISTRAASTNDRKLREEFLKQKSSLKSVSAQLEEETESSKTLRAERAALLDAVRSERRASQRLAAELRSAAKRLETELGVIHGMEPAPEAVQGGFSAQKGRLPWPVPGRVEVTFGKKVDPGSGMVMVQKGIDIRAAQSEPVRAVFGGKVAFASWFDGYGRLIIVDHGEGYFTLYGHLESFRARAGQELQQHQVLGFVGDSGSTKGAYLYFELRKKRVPIDPLRWLVRSR